MAGTESATGTLWFVHWLRAFSVGAVVFVHLGVMFWAGGPEPAAFARVEPLPHSVHAPWQFIVPYTTVHTLYSYTAVGLFFLVSGFVIPLTMENKTVGRFLVVRAFRIYPVWIIGIGIIAAIFAIQSESGLSSGHLSLGTWIANATTLTGLTGFTHAPVLNPVGWTLVIELKWYVLCAFIVATVGLHRTWPLVALAGSWTLYSLVVWRNFEEVAVDHYRPWVVSQVLAWDAKHMLVILIGVCFYNRFRSGWTTTRLVATVSLCVALLTVTHWRITDDWGYAAGKFAAYLIAIAVFAVAYATRQRFRQARVVRLAADLSFPVYVTHFVLGMVLLDAFVRVTGSPTGALAATLAVIIALSALLHYCVETPLIEFGKRVRWPLTSRAARDPDQAPS